MYNAFEMFSFLSRGEYAFLVGNGINIANGGLTWEKMLKKVVLDVLGCESYIYGAIGKQGITNTEIQNIIPLEYNRKTGQIISSNELMQSVGRNISIPFHNNRMLNYIEKNHAEILTTNFDFNIEDYLWGKKYQRRRKGNGSYTTSGYYPWDYYYCNRKQEKDKPLCKIWHIHGDIEHWQSVILSLSRYVGASSKAKKQINMRDQSSELEKCKGTWLHTFFTKPLVIVGLALDPQEFFLRYLLIERAGWMKTHGIRMQPSFYLLRAGEEIEPGKAHFLSFLGIDTVMFHDNDIFNDSIWN